MYRVKNQTGVPGHVFLVVQPPDETPDRDVPRLNGRSLGIAVAASSLLLDSDSPMGCFWSQALRDRHAHPAGGGGGGGGTITTAQSLPLRARALLGLRSWGREEGLGAFGCKNRRSTAAAAHTDLGVCGRRMGCFWLQSLQLQTQLVNRGTLPGTGFCVVYSDAEWFPGGD